MNELIKELAIVVLLLVLAFALPLLTLWALNTLFPVLALEYSIGNYFAIMVLGIFIRGIKGVKNE